ncbi:MAG: hypothetical protein OSA89_16235 [Mariniblastus sp.]|nr:hypothetical protein [Mariniblastus sp.]
MSDAPAPADRVLIGGLGFRGFSLYTLHVFHVRRQNAVGVIAVDDWLAGDFMDVASFSACAGVKKS